MQAHKTGRDNSAEASEESVPFRGLLRYEQQAEVAAVGQWFEKVISRICSPFLSDGEIGRILKGSDVWMDSDEIRRRLTRMARAKPRATPAKDKKVTARAKSGPAGAAANNAA